MHPREAQIVQLSANPEDNSKKIEGGKSTDSEGEIVLNEAHDDA